MGSSSSWDVPNRVNAFQGSQTGQAFDQTIQCKDTSQVAQLLCFTWTGEADMGITWEI